MKNRGPQNNNKKEAIKWKMSPNGYIKLKKGQCGQMHMPYGSVVIKIKLVSVKPLKILYKIEAGPGREILDSGTIHDCEIGYKDNNFNISFDLPDNNYGYVLPSELTKFVLRGTRKQLTRRVKLTLDNRHLAAFSQLKQIPKLSNWPSSAQPSKK